MPIFFHADFRSGPPLQAVVATDTGSNCEAVSDSLVKKLGLRPTPLEVPVAIAMADGFQHLSYATAELKFSLEPGADVNEREFYLLPRIVDVLGCDAVLSIFTLYEVGLWNREAIRTGKEKENLSIRVLTKKTSAGTLCYLDET